MAQVKSLSAITATKDEMYVSIALAWGHKGKTEHLTSMGRGLYNRYCLGDDYSETAKDFVLMATLCEQLKRNEGDVRVNGIKTIHTTRFVAEGLSEQFSKIHEFSGDHDDTECIHGIVDKEIDVQRLLSYVRAQYGDDLSEEDNQEVHEQIDEFMKQVDKETGHKRFMIQWGEYNGSGYVDFDNSIDIVYTPVLWDPEENNGKPGYTGKDILDLCNGDKALAERIYLMCCDWQHPETVLLELKEDEENELDHQMSPASHEDAPVFAEQRELKDEASGMKP